MRQTIQLATRFPSSHIWQMCAIVSLNIKYSQKWSKIANNGTPLYRAPKQAANKQITQGKKIPHLSAGAPRACSQNWQSFIYKPLFTQCKPHWKPQKSQGRWFSRHNLWKFNGVSKHLQLSCPNFLHCCAFSKKCAFLGTLFSLLLEAKDQSPKSAPT